MLKDYVQQDVFGNWNQIKDSSIIKTLYLLLAQLDWQSMYFLLNVQSINYVKIPSDYKNIVISFHTEYYDYYLLIDFFKKYSDCNFLLLSDGILHENIWPNNVTYVQWISWGEQLKLANEIYGHNISNRNPKKKLSSLSSRHEFHKAAITGYLINEYSESDYIISWHDIRYEKILYHLDAQFSSTNTINNYLISDRFVNLKTTSPDGYEQKNNTAILNGNWQTTAYLDCAINLTNESIFNSNFSYDNKCLKYTTPYLTEKTWKPLLARQPFLPIGQYQTLAHLSDLGMHFNYGLDVNAFDSCIADFSRLEKVFDLLDIIKNISVEDLIEMTSTSAEYNLHIIVNGIFKKNCDSKNASQVEKINSWIKEK
jgi:hypothetical protein